MALLLLYRPMVVTGRAAHEKREPARHERRAEACELLQGAQLVLYATIEASNTGALRIRRR